MKKALMLTVTQTEELPTPLTLRLLTQGVAQPVSLSLREGEEILSDTPIRIEAFYTGALLGFLCLSIPPLAENQSKWLLLGFSDKEFNWKDSVSTAVSGPRLQLLVEPIRPLSPIIETTENSEGELSMVRSGRESVEGRDGEGQAALELQQERESNSKRQKELQMKIMELKQTLGREAWRYRCTVEQMEKRYKAEVGHFVILMERAKVLQTRDSSAIADLSAKLKLAEESRSQLRRDNESAKDRLEAAENARKQLEDALKVTMEELATVRSSLEKAENLVKSQSEEIATLRNSQKQEKSDRKGMKSVLQEKESQDFRQTISSLQSALSLCRSALEDKERELKLLTFQYESLKAKSSVYESTLSSLKASMSVIEKPTELTVPDLIDDMLKAYIATHPDVSVSFARISEGQYAIGSKKVLLTVRNGALVIRVGGGFMILDEYLKMYGDQSLRTPRRRLRRREDEVVRSHSLGLERHHRSIATAGDATRRALDEQENAGNTTERNHVVPSPKPVYWRETVSSHNKVTAKGTGKQKTEGRAVREGIILRDL